MQIQNPGSIGIRVILLVSVSCFLLTGCPPKVPSESQAIDAKLGSIHESGKVYPADSILPGYHSGQWLQYKSVDENEEPTILTYKLIASDGFNHSIELTSEGYHGNKSIYLEIQYDPGRSTDSLVVRRVLIQETQGVPKESSPEDLSLKKDVYHALASQFFVSWADSPTGEDITVAAGQFLGCHKMEITLEVDGFAFRAHTWHHPALPMHGLVKAQRSDGIKGSLELLSFGQEGAQSNVLEAVR